MILVKRNNKLIFLIVILQLINFVSILPYTISTPGKYILGDNIVETGNVISIQADNVILDLSQHIISGGINGIVVESGNTGIVIKNGFVTDLTNAGVSIKENCTDITIEKLQITECGGPAVEILGISSTDSVSNICVESVTTLSCSFSSMFSSVFNVAYGSSIVLNNLVINDVHNISNDISLVRLNHCNECFGSNILGTNNTAARIVGVDLITSSSCVFQNVNFSGNLAVTDNFYGYRLTDNCTNNIFELCRVVAGKSQMADSIGFDVDNGSIANVFRQCTVNALFGAVNSYGFLFTGLGNECNIVSETFVSKNFANTGTTIGFEIDGADNGQIIQSFAGYNSAPGGLSAGVRFNPSTGGDFWNILENKFIQNDGLNSSNSYGILVDLIPNNNFFIKNIASKNGITAANQFLGILSTSITLVDQNTINSISAPWTNVGIVPAVPG